MHVGGAEEVALFDRPIADERVAGVDAQNLVRRPVLVAGDDLARALMMGEAARTAGHSATRASPSAATRVMIVPVAGGRRRPVWLPGMTNDHVRAQALELFLHHHAGRLADGDQEDDGRHADDDAQHGEPGPRLVLAKSPQGHAEDE